MINGAFVVSRRPRPLIEALRRIDQGKLQLAVVERDGKIVGTVTDGDVQARFAERYRSCCLGRPGDEPQPDHRAGRDFEYRRR